MKFTSEIFQKLYDLDVTEWIEKDYKGLTYLSWAVAWKLLQEQDENAEYEVMKDVTQMPYFSRDGVHFVYTRIKAFETVKDMYLPVMNNNHQAVDKPNSTQVNNAIQRCLAKNVAMFGIGLKLYVGEDLEDVKVVTPTKAQNTPKNTSITPKSINTPIKAENATEGQITTINTLVTLVGGGNHEAMFKTYKVNSYAELTEAKAQQIIEQLKAKCKEKNIPFSEV